MWLNYYYQYIQTGQTGECSGREADSIFIANVNLVTHSGKILQNQS